MANQSGKVNIDTLKINTGAAYQSVKELKDELKALKDTLVSAEQGTEEYTKALELAAKAQHMLKEQTEEVRAVAMDTGEILGNITKSVGGMVAGFQAAKGVMNLFGVENETVLKSLQKMQSLMAITQALPSIESGIKAFRRLGTQIKFAATQTGIFGGALRGLQAAAGPIGIVLGAIAATIGVIAANWDKVTGVLQRFGIISEQVSEEEKQRLKELADKVKELQKEYEKVQTSQQYSKLNKDAKKQYDDLKDSLELLTAAYNKLEAERKQAFADKNGKELRRINEEQLAVRKQMIDIENSQKAILADADNYKKTAKEIAEEQKKAHQEYQKNQNELLNIQLERAKRITDEKQRTQAILDIEKERLKYIDKDTAAYEQQLTKIKDIEKSLKDIAIDEQDFQNQLNRVLNPDYKAPVSEYEIPIELKVKVEEPEEEGVEDLATKMGDRIRARIDSTIDSMTEIRSTQEELFAQMQFDLDYALQHQLISYEQYAEGVKNLQDDIADYQITSTTTAAYLVGDILSSMGELMEEGSEEAKAFQIMGATINMLAGITAAISGLFTTKSGPWDIALAALQATAIAASGGATIAKMVRTNKNNASQSAKTNVSTSALTSITAPVQYTQDVQGASIEGAIKDTRVYVLESDISNTQKKVNVAESEARY